MEKPEISEREADRNPDHDDMNYDDHMSQFMRCGSDWAAREPEERSQRVTRALAD